MTDTLHHQDNPGSLGEYESAGQHILDNQTTGDIVYAADSGNLTRLPIGTTGQMLGVSGGIPAWGVGTGRTASYVIAASDATPLQKSQADVILTGTNDQVTINAALVTANATNGEVYCIGTTFDIAAQINVLPNTELDFAPTAMIYPTANINTFMLYPNSRLIGNNALIDYNHNTKAGKAFVIDSSVVGTIGDGFLHPPYVENFRVRGKVGAGAGTGIYLTCPAASATHIYQADFDNILIYGMEYGISLVTAGTSPDSWINGCRFEGFTIQNTVNNINISSGVGSAQIAGNYFEGEIQWGSSTTGIVNNGNYNYFQVFFWDNAGSIVITSTGSQNVYFCYGASAYNSFPFVSCMTLSASDIYIDQQGGDNNLTMYGLKFFYPSNWTPCTIANGVITIYKSGVYSLAPQGGAADDLITINGGYAGAVIVLCNNDASHIVTVKSAASTNILLAGNVDCSLAAGSTFLTLMYIPTANHGSVWVELCRAAD
jgi:hypothetical protein